MKPSLKRKVTVFVSECGGDRQTALEWADGILSLLDNVSKGAKKNIEDNYYFLSGWMESQGNEGEFKVKEDGTYVSQYKEDPDMKPLIRVDFGEDIVYIYEYAITIVVQPDGLMCLTRID